MGSSKKKCRCAAVFIGVFVIFLISLFVLFNEDFRRFSKQNTELASWVQAIGSIIAIFSSSFMVWWQMDAIRTEKRVDEDREIEELKINIDCVIRDELEYITGNLKKYDGYYLEGAIGPKPFGKYLFVHRELNPPIIDFALKKYYSKFNKNQRLAFKTVIALVYHLNDYANKGYEARKSKNYSEELKFVESYIKSGCCYRYLLIKFLEGENVPESAKDDAIHIREMTEELQLNCRHYIYC